MHFSCSRIATCSALRLFFYYYFLNFCCSLIATCSALRLLFIYLFCFLQPDRHLLGAETPPESPHVLIVESTYGVQLHETRAVREQRFTSAVHGIIRRASTFNTTRIDHLYTDPHHPDTRLFLHYGDLSDASGLRHILAKVRPHEIYNLAAQSHVRVSFDQPEYTADIVATGTLRLLEATREYIAMAEDPVRVYQAGSSEMYGSAPAPQSEATPFAPRSPYAVGKVAGYWYAANYREAYGMYVANGILFNHESPRRGPNVPAACACGRPRSGGDARKRATALAAHSFLKVRDARKTCTRSFYLK